MRDKAITELYQDKLFLSMCKKYGKENSEELRSEVVSILLEMPMDKLTHIIENGYLLPYSINIVRLQSISKRDSFNKKFGQQNIIVSLDEVEIIEDSTDIEELELKQSKAEYLLNKIKSDSLDQHNEFFYGSRLVLLKVEKGSIKAVSRATGIPYRSMQDALKKYIQHLKEWQKK